MSFLRLVGLLLLLPSAAAAADVSGKVTVDGAPASEAVVYLEGGPPAAAPPPRVVMDQKNLAFQPRILPVQRNTQVEFTNSDDVQHNVFSPSSIDRFNLGTYSRGEARSITLSHAGDVVVLCNIHMEMEAHIVVVDGPYFSTTDAAGAFRIADVPPGSYTVKVWRQSWVPTTRSIEVEDAAPVVLDLDLQK